MLLASCGTDIRFHNWPQGDFSGCFQQPDKSLTPKNISWCSEGELLVFTSADGISTIVNVGPAIKHCQSITDISIEVAVFSRTVKSNIAIGTRDGQVMFYDINKKTVVQELPQLPDQVVFLEYGARDMSLAGGCTNGQIFLYNAKAVLCASFFIPNSDSLSTMRCHPTDSNILGGGNAEGVVAIWDSNAGDLKFVTQLHSNVVTDMAYSQKVNTLVSVGLDKKIFGYDLRTKSCTFSNVLDIPLTSVAYSLEYDNYAVSSFDGKIFCFDARSIKTPVQVILAHNSPINKIAFQTENIEEDDFAADNQRMIELSKAFPEVGNLLNVETSPTNLQSPHHELYLKDNLSYGEPSTQPCGECQLCKDSMRKRISGSMDSMGMEPVTEAIKVWVNNLASSRKVLEKNLPVPVDDDIEATQVRDALLEASKLATELLGEMINKEFLKIRMAVSREFVSMESRMNLKLYEINQTIKKLAVQGPRMVEQESEYKDSTTQAQPSRIPTRGGSNIRAP